MSQQDANEPDWSVYEVKQQLVNRASKIVFRQWPPETKPRVNEFRNRLHALLKEYEDDPDFQRRW